MVAQHGHLQIVVRNDADIPQGGCGSSARAGTNFLQIQVENGGNQKANFVRKDRSNYHCRNRAPFDIPLVHFKMIFSMASLRLSTG